MEKSVGTNPPTTGTTRSMLQNTNCNLWDWWYTSSALSVEPVVVTLAKES